MTEPGSYNRVQVDPHRVWFACSCGWHTRKRRPGKPPKLVAFRPFLCPRCGQHLSDTTAVR